MTTLKAKRAGTCVRCREKIQVGDEIEWDKEVGARHVSCEEKPPHPDMPRVLAYLFEKENSANMDPFARSLLDQYRSRGYLTDRQITAIRDKRLDAPKQTDLPGAEIVPAGRYAVPLVKDGKTYEMLVHIWRGSQNPRAARAYGYDEGNRLDVRDCLARIVEAGVVECAVRFGKYTQRCSICDNRLMNNLSVELGIGPTCGGRFYSKDEWREVKRKARLHLRAEGVDPSGNRLIEHRLPQQLRLVS